MINVYVNQLGIAGPGLRGWQTSRNILAGKQPYVDEEYQKPTGSILPKNEHRRTTNLIKLALTAAQDAEDGSSFDTAALTTVFASADGDLEITDKICQALALPDRPVSPTLFHNSVHNAPAGYWSIATHSHMPSTSISACDYTFAAGLLEAACQAQQGQSPVLLVVYDYPPPFPLSEKRVYRDPFAVAILLTANLAEQNMCELNIALTPRVVSHTDADCPVETVPLDNPNACALPLLQAIAAQADRALELDYNHEQQLTISIRNAAANT